MYLCDMHTHSIASGHGTSCTIADMAKAADKKGLTLLGITDHGPATPAAGTASYFRSLIHAPRQRCGITLRYGVELNIIDYSGNVDLESSILSQLDYAIISMHRPTLKPGSPSANTVAYIQAMRHPGVKIIGHLDDTSYPVNMDELIKACADQGVIPELNNSSLSPSGYRGDTRPNARFMLECCVKYNVPLLLSSDSHGTAGIGDFSYAESFAREEGFPSELILNSTPQKVMNFLQAR